MRIVCVMGMHRSGTSLTAGVLEALGVDFGPRATMLAPGEENARGFWEQEAVTDFDDEVLAALGGSWYEPPPLGPGWQGAPALWPLRDRGRVLMEELFAGTPARAWAGWKDPRMSLLLPFWRNVLPVSATILVHRDPREVAASLEQRDGIDTEWAAYLWLRHVVSAWQADDRALALAYCDFFDRRDESVEAMCSHLGIARTSAGDAAVRALVDPGLHRERPAPTRSGTTMRRAVTLWEHLAAPRPEVDRLIAREHRRLLRAERLHAMGRRTADVARNWVPVAAKARIRDVARRAGLRDRRELPD